MTAADALSRAMQTENMQNNVKPIAINKIELIPVSREKYKKLQEQTVIELDQLYEVIMSGWPDTSKNYSYSCQQFWQVRSQLSILDGIIYKGMSIVIPPSMRKKFLNIIHESHLGIVKCKQRAREAVY